MKANIEFLTKFPIAHRGLHDGNIEGGDTPENSFKAFEKAIESGYSIEMDVRFSKDRELVVFHDDTLDRMTDGVGLVENFTLAELKEFRLNNTDERIPTFQEFLAFVDARTPILVEIKDMPVSYNLVEDTLDELMNYKGEFALQSFNPLYLKTIKKLNPEFLRGLLATQDIPENLGKFKRLILSKMLLNPIIKPDFISYDIRYLPHKKAKKKNRPLLGWTVRTDEEYQKVKDYVDNIIFEHIKP